MGKQYNDWGKEEGHEADSQGSRDENWIFKAPGDPCVRLAEVFTHETEVVAHLAQWSTWENAEEGMVQSEVFSQCYPKYISLGSQWEKLWIESLQKHLKLFHRTIVYLLTVMVKNIGFAFWCLKFFFLILINSF